MSSFTWTIGGIAANDDSEDGRTPRKLDASFHAADLVAGIVNVTGNSCFLNSLLQALAVLPPFHTFLRELVNAGEASEAARKDALSSFHAKTTYETMTGKPLSDTSTTYHLEDDELLETLAERADSKQIAIQLLRTLSCLLWPLHSGGHSSGWMGLTDGAKSLVPTVALGAVNDMFDDRAQHDVHELYIQILACLDDDELQRIQQIDAAAALFLKWSKVVVDADTAPISRLNGRLHSSLTRSIEYAPVSSKSKPVPAMTWASSVLHRKGACSTSLDAQRRMPRPASQTATRNPMRGATASRVLCDACALPPLEITKDGITPKAMAANGGASFTPPSPSAWIQDAFVALELTPTPSAAGAGRKFAGRATKLRTGGLTIEDLLAYSFRDDYISGYQCENAACGHINYEYDARLRRVHPKENNARRQTCIAHLPPVLVLQIRRSDFNAHLGMATKASTFIDFDFTINMQPFTMEGRDASSHRRASDAYYSYELMSLVQHMGRSSGFGHYITYRRVPAAMADPDIVAPQWVRTSDKQVAVVSPAEVLAAEAYLLFYVRKDVRQPYRINSSLLASADVSTVLTAEFRSLMVVDPRILVRQLLHAADSDDDPAAREEVFAALTSRIDTTKRVTHSRSAQKLVWRLRNMLAKQCSAGLAEEASRVAGSVMMVWFPSESD